MALDVSTAVRRQTVILIGLALPRVTSYRALQTRRLPLWQLSATVGGAVITPSAPAGCGTSLAFRAPSRRTLGARAFATVDGAMLDGGATPAAYRPRLTVGVRSSAPGGGVPHWDDLGLHPSLRAALGMLGLERPTEPQALTFGRIAAGDDVVLLAETGASQGLPDAARLWCC